ncbi:unnamed protein product [Phyllotreta striolata]|uniref:ANKLE2 third alpha/beta domain-containing protein n=1 Tax=Phyllotreta striolata TaxID=444603 RepID=A0A9N9TLK0_PHYSR|nr:unnamed protein product [Phyllotreta striolata]
MHSNQSLEPIYYGVFAPLENRSADQQPTVFTDKTEALQAAKQCKKSRFKAFRFYHEAAEFALNGPECPETDPKSPECSLVGEKASAFRAPKPQELVELRKAIENGDLEWVMEAVWRNPRYLVSSGDTPSILKEGARYNALHVAALSKNAPIAQFVLDTVADPTFIRLLYGDDGRHDDSLILSRSAMLLDLYLNTPNKGLNETPLHFAAKHGAADVVEVLVSYAQCDKTARNKFMKTAEQINCERAEGDDLASIKKRIERLLHDTYYVPVLRAVDDSEPAVIGEPFLTTSRPPPNRDILSPRLEIHAYAGPMEASEAQRFKKSWKTPPRSIDFQQRSATNPRTLRYTDPKKGLERVGKRLADAFRVTWKEYWEFLDCFVDIASDEGLRSLEDYLWNRSVGNGGREEGLKSCGKFDGLSICDEDSEVQSSRSSRFKSDRSKKDSTRDADPELKGEEDDGKPKKNTVVSPISSLCAAFTACRLEDDDSAADANENCVKLADSRLGEDYSETQALLHVDKACQVFANRISNDIQHAFRDGRDPRSERHLAEGLAKTLEAHLAQLEATVTSYAVDERFAAVDFRKMHARLGRCIARKVFERPLDNLDAFLRMSLAFLSTDEGRSKVTKKRELTCLLGYVVGKKRLEDGERCWKDEEGCSCVFRSRRWKKNSFSKGGGGFRSGGRSFEDEGGVGIRGALDFADCVRNGFDKSLASNRLELRDLDEDDDKFYTPPESPSFLDDEDSEDEFVDSILPKQDVFIHGNNPSKTDCDVFNALCYSEVELDCKKYPYVYSWFHMVSLYTKEERESWVPRKNVAKQSPSDIQNVSFRLDPAKTSTPSKSWLRITGENSPVRKRPLKSKSLIF